MSAYSGSNISPKSVHAAQQHVTIYPVCISRLTSRSQTYVLEPRKQSVNLLKQLVEDGPSSMSDYERKGEPAESSAPLQLQLASGKSQNYSRTSRDGGVLGARGCARFSEGKKKSSALPPPAPLHQH